MSRAGRVLACGLTALAVVVACTDSYLYDPRRDAEVPVDRAVSFDGRFCTVGSNEVVRPIKLVVAMDASQSMRVSDPDGTRATALVQLIENLPRDPEVSIAVMLFAGSTTAFLTQTPGNPPQDGFVQVSTMDDATRRRLTEQLLTFRNPDNSPNRDSTDFVKPLSDIYSLINTDIARSRLEPGGSQALAQARYSVIFLSDGKPTNDQDDELIQGDAVVRIRQLRDLVEEVRVNTVHVFLPTQPVSSCDIAGDGGCPLLIINQNADRLEQMATLGGGNFRDFRNNEPINFLDFTFGQVRRSFIVKEVVASNFSAPPGSPVDVGDTDGDGLTDAREAEVGTNPNLMDTDGDGFSDGVEVYFRDRGVDFNPTQIALPDGGGLDKGCPPLLRPEDTDCDRLLDCDEQFIGTNANLADSDRDGVPDGVEWRGGTQGASNDLDEDPDNDGLTSRAELRLHTRPLEVDTASLSVDGYRYSFEADGPPDALGRQCYKLRVDNVLLAPTIAAADDAGVVVRGAGFNDISLSVAMVPADDPTARTLVRTYRVDTVRYPVGGIKSPADGVIHVEPEYFVDGCPGRVTASPPTP
ncbi:vWA domain-containing protein [Pyxidicoccus sp. MSG2]|uniref:vWA domain-containing protein n=1 Tax=Pyxidicoccus sp. MSG2 TaxID=2996790 RepID=UPI00226E209E|nr:VWA domain-containing protein [Pyxidicoccus sp. MSG2]MCY1016508.1 VWA domain-containing protein [Pyxidicoccus sp. MSG2]